MSGQTKYCFGMKDLRALRLAAKLSQDALAVLAHTSQPQIDRLEKGKRQLTVAWAIRLAPHLGCKSLDLLPIEAQDINSSSDTKNSKQGEQNSDYHGRVADRDQEGQEMVLPDSVLSAIGRLTIEVEGLKAELREIKAARAATGPKKARGR